MVKCVDCYHYGFCIGNGGNPCNIYRPDYETLQQLLSTCLGENDGLVDKLDKMQQELTEAQKAVEVLAELLDEKIGCLMNYIPMDETNEAVGCEEKCLPLNKGMDVKQCWSDYAYAKAKEKEATNDANPAK